MPICKYCGKKMSDTATFCPECGERQVEKPNDKGGMKWSVLGALCPIAGLILYLKWKDTKPLTAKTAGLGALVCVMMAAFWIILLLLIGFFASGGF